MTERSKRIETETHRAQRKLVRRLDEKAVENETARAEAISISAVNLATAERKVEEVERATHKLACDLRDTKRMLKALPKRG